MTNKKHPKLLRVIYWYCASRKKIFDIELSSLTLETRFQRGIATHKMVYLLSVSTFLHSDDKVLIVIGRDSYYKDEDEEDRFVISRWMRRKVASQFNEEYLDGRKSFIFSWDTKHRPIHEEALRHFLDLNKKGVKFVYTPKPKP